MSVVSQWGNRGGGTGDIRNTFNNKNSLKTKKEWNVLKLSDHNITVILEPYNLFNITHSITVKCLLVKTLKVNIIP